jgi:hypothetical protein
MLKVVSGCVLQNCYRTLGVANHISGFSVRLYCKNL